MFVPFLAGDWADGLQEIDDLVEDWTPEPLVAPETPFEQAENEKRPTIIGLVARESRAHCSYSY
jgi:hypothetical protein